MSNINLGTEVKDSYQDLSEKLDIIEGSMIALNSGANDAFLPEISPNELPGLFGTPNQSDVLDHNIFKASLASEAERNVIASVSKISNAIFEIGTGSGGTTLLMAICSDPEAKVHTIDLPVKSKAILYEQGDSPVLAYASVNSRTTDDYVYKNNQYENKESSRNNPYNSRGFWQDNVVPFTMKVITLNIYSTKVFITHFNSYGIYFFVELSLNFKTSLCCSISN